MNPSLDKEEVISRSPNLSYINQEGMEESKIKEEILNRVRLKTAFYSLKKIL